MLPGIIFYEFGEHGEIWRCIHRHRSDADRRRKNTASKQGRLKLLAHHLPSAAAAAAAAAVSAVA